MTYDVTGKFKGCIDFWSIIFKVGQNILQIMPSSQRCLIQVQMSLGKIVDSMTGDVTGKFKGYLYFWSINFKVGGVHMENKLPIMPRFQGFLIQMLMSLGKYSGKTGDVTGIFKGCLYFWSIIFKVGAVQMVKQFTNYAKFQGS